MQEPGWLKKGKLKTQFATIGALLFCGGAVAQGPYGYWLTGSRNEVVPTIARYDGGGIFSFDSAGGYDSLIAVSGDVRTAASGASQYSFVGGVTDFGALYGLDGKFSGRKYESLSYDPDFNVRAYDGTTDGRYNYFVNVGFQGGVWRTGRDWSNPELLFALGGAGDHLGITYDPYHNTIWTSGGVGSNLIEEFDMEGNRVSWFHVSGGTNLSCLAMDYRTQTLWMSPAERPGAFYNYSRTGQALGHFDSQFTTTMNFTAGEFDLGTVPEPTLFWGFGLAALAVRRRGRSIKART